MCFVGLCRASSYSLRFRLYPRLDASRPENVAESIAKETIQTLHTLVVQFTRGLVRRAITLRELDFALCAHTKVWRLGERVVRPPHVRRALELCGGARLSVRMHFGSLMEEFSEGEESDDEDEDVPLVVRARMRKAKAIASDEDEDEDVDTSAGEHEQMQQQAGPSRDVQANEAAWQRWPSSHRAIYSPFVYAPDSIAPAHPFGVYAPGTMPEQQPGRHVTYEDDDDDSEEVEEDLNLMPTETDEEALRIELKAEAQLDAADARAAAAYEAGIWRELRSVSAGAGASARANLRKERSRKRRRCSGDGEEGEVGDVSPSSMRLRTRTTRKRRRKANQHGGGGHDEGSDPESLAGVGVKVPVSAAVIEDSTSSS